MKKKIPFILFSLIVVFVLYAVFVTNEYHKAINIIAPVSLVTKHISALDKIANWYTPFASAEPYSLKISSDSIEYNKSSLRLAKHVNLSIWYQVSENNKSETVIFSVLADTAGSSKVILSYKSTLWNKIIDRGTISKNAEASLLNLKDYFADTKKMYGYEMEITSVTDTAFLFTSKVVANHVKNESFKKLFESLIKEATEKNLGYNDVRIYYTSPFGNDSIHLFTSIGINNSQNVPITGVFSLKKMPYNGRLLTAYYQGSFNHINNALDALGQFKSDNSLTTMAIPFVKLMTEGIYFEDDQIIQAKVYYPIN